TLATSNDLFAFLKGCQVLLDLQPVEGCPLVLPPPVPVETFVDEASLGLAVVSAAWASTRKPMFKRVVMTGRARSDKIGDVGGIERKYATTCLYAHSLELHCAFMAPKESSETAGLWREQAYVEVIDVEDWRTYFNEVVPRLLTDGF